MIGVEEIDQPRVLAFHEAESPVLHETADGQPEIVPHHDDALHPSAITLPQGLHQFRVLFFLLGVQPLLELVENKQHFLARPECPPSAQCGQCFLQTQVVGKIGTVASASR